MLRFVPDVDCDTMRSELTALPGLAAHVDARRPGRPARSFMSLFHAVVGVMSAIGSLMAFALLFNDAVRRPR
jgi:hypothetical protein